MKKVSKRSARPCIVNDALSKATTTAFMKEKMGLLEDTFVSVGFLHS